jgi:AcrR family transcriptional regulator
MPHPSLIDRGAVVELARQMIEAEGVENVSLARLAEAVHVKAPSLYRHFGSKSELLQAVNLETARALVTVIQAAVQTTPNPRERVFAMASAYHAFVHSNPRTYGLAYSNLPPDTRPDPAQLEALAIPLQGVMAVMVGEENSLTALRGLWALIHGFASLEINGHFQRGGNLDAAFAQAIEAYITGWEHQ